MTMKDKETMAQIVERWRKAYFATGTTGKSYLKLGKLIHNDLEKHFAVPSMGMMVPHKKCQKCEDHRKYGDAFIKADKGLVLTKELDKIAIKFGTKRVEGAKLQFRPFIQNDDYVAVKSGKEEPLIFDELSEPSKEWKAMKSKAIKHVTKNYIGPPPEIHTFDHSTPVNLPRERHGETCIQCKRDYPHAVKELQFVCWGCKNGH